MVKSTEWPVTIIVHVFGGSQSFINHRVDILDVAVMMHRLCKRRTQFLIF